MVTVYLNYIRNDKITTADKLNVITTLLKSSSASIHKLFEYFPDKPMKMKKRLKNLIKGSDDKLLFFKDSSLFRNKLLDYMESIVDNIITKQSEKHLVNDVSKLLVEFMWTFTFKYGMLGSLTIHGSKEERDKVFTLLMNMSDKLKGEHKYNFKLTVSLIVTAVWHDFKYFDYALTLFKEKPDLYKKLVKELTGIACDPYIILYSLIRNVGTELLPDIRSMSVFSIYTIYKHPEFILEFMKKLSTLKHTGQLIADLYACLKLVEGVINVKLKCMNDATLFIVNYFAENMHKLLTPNDMGITVSHSIDNNKATSFMTNTVSYTINGNEATVTDVINIDSIRFLFRYSMNITSIPANHKQFLDLIFNNDKIVKAFRKLMDTLATTTDVPYNVIGMYDYVTSNIYWNFYTLTQTKFGKMLLKSKYRGYVAGLHLLSIDNTVLEELVFDNYYHQSTNKYFNILDMIFYRTDVTLIKKILTNKNIPQNIKNYFCFKLLVSSYFISDEISTSTKLITKNQDTFTMYCKILNYITKIVTFSKRQIHHICKYKHGMNISTVLTNNSNHATPITEEIVMAQIKVLTSDIPISYFKLVLNKFFSTKYDNVTKINILLKHRKELKKLLELIFVKTSNVSNLYNGRVNVKVINLLLSLAYEFKDIRNNVNFKINVLKLSKHVPFIAKIFTNLTAKDLKCTKLKKEVIKKLCSIILSDDLFDRVAANSSKFSSIADIYTRKSLISAFLNLPISLTDISKTMSNKSLLSVIKVLKENSAYNTLKETSSLINLLMSVPKIRKHVLTIGGYENDDTSVTF